MSKKTSILDQAKKIGEETAKQEELKKAAAKAERDYLTEAVEEMKALIVKELRKINNKENKHGTFKVEFKENVGLSKYDVFAYLTVKDKQKGFADKKVAWFKAAIVSGTYDASDDCRNIPYTDPCVWARFYPPYPNHETHNNQWDQNEDRWYHNGGWTISASSVERMEKFFEEMTKQLAAWF